MLLLGRRGSSLSQPSAIGHGLNPFYTHLAWSPTGANVAAAALIPLPSVLAWPLTAAFGPVVAYNVMTLLAPAFAAATAYLLCLEVGGRRWPAIAGGWLFGFSSYELSQLIGHANLMLTALLPLLVLMVLWRLRGRLGTASFVGLEAVLLAAQLLTSTELLATACGFGALALVVAWVLLPDRRGELQRVAVELIGAGVIAAAVCSPYIDWALIRQHPLAPHGAADDAVTDLASLVVPMGVTWIRYAQGVEARFTANFAEQGGYLGVPLLIALVLAVWRLRRRRAMWIAVTVAVVALILSMGNRLQVAGHRAIPLPWRLVSGAPIFKAITPDRMIVYVWLAAAVLVTLWLARPGRWEWARWALVLAAVVVLLPDGSSGAYDGRPDQPPLVATNAYKRVLPRGGQVLVLPFAAAGPSMMWQADTDFWFRTPEGYLSTNVPAAVIANPVADAMGADPNPPISSDELRAFLSGYGVQIVLVDPAMAGSWPQQLQAIGLHGQMLDGVLVYHVR